MVYLMLRRVSSWIFLFFLLFLSNSIGIEVTGETAKGALTVLKSERGASIAANVTHVRGHRGQDQPLLWEITSRISDGERVFVISGEKIIADTIYSSGGGVSVDLRRLKIDSGEVFHIANRAAVKANVGFDSIDYELLAAPLGNAPLWLIYLRDIRGRDVGKLEVSGESSKILRSKWFAPRAVVRQPIGPDDGDRGSVLRSYTPGIDPDEDHGESNDGQAGTFAWKTGKRLKRGLQTVGNGFSRIFGNQAEVSTESPRHKSPQTSRISPRP
jgi:hypothetical protein